MKRFFLLLAFAVGIGWVLFQHNAHPPAFSRPVCANPAGLPRPASRPIPPSVQAGAGPSRASWTIAYGAEFWARDSQPREATHPLDLAKVVDRVANAFVGENEKRVVSKSYSATYDSNGLKFFPARPAAALSLDASSDLAQNGVTINTISVRDGARTVYEAGSRGAAGSCTGNTAQRLLGDSGIVEHFAAGRAGVALTWILPENPGGPDLELIAQLQGVEFATATERGLHFADAASAVRICVGAAELVDAAGTRTPLTMRAEASQFMVHVPASVLDRAVFPVAIDPLISAEFGLDRPVLDSVLPGFQRLPSVASAGGDYLVVWEDLRDGYRIYGTRVSGQGTILDRAGILIAGTDRGASEPAVASNGHDYFVTWVRSVGVGFGHVYGTIVSRGGAVAQTNGWAISQFEARQATPHLAGQGSNYLLVWHQSVLGTSDRGSYVFATRVGNDGRTLDGDGFPISIELGFDPVLASDGHDSLIIWRTGLGLLARPVSALGASGPALPFGPASTGISAPEIASDGQRYLVVWEQHADNLDPLSNINAVRLDATGTMLEQPRSFASGDHQYHPAVSGQEGEFMIIWEEDGPTPSQYEVRRVGMNGANGVSTTPLVVDRSNHNRGGLALVGNGQDYLAVWHANIVPDTFMADVFALRLQSDGAPLDPAPMLLSIGPNDETFPAVASDGQDFLVVWQDYRHGLEADIYGTRLTSDGTILDPDGLPIVTAAGAQTAPAVASNGREFLVVWEDERGGVGTPDVYGGRIGVGGRVLESNGFAIASAPSVQHLPAVASDGTNFFVVWHDQRLGAVHTVMGTGVDRAGNIRQPSGTTVSPVGVQNHVALAGNSDGYFAVWEDRRNYATTGLDLFGTRLSLAGDVLDPDGISICVNDAPQLHPAVAAHGTDFLVAWEDQRLSAGTGSNIFATRIAGGQVLDPDGFLVNENGSRPSVAGGADGYLVTWQTWEGNWNIEGAKISLDGAATQPFRLSGSREEQEAPAVAANGAAYLAVFHARSALSTRVHGQVISNRAPEADASATPRRAVVGGAGTSRVLLDGRASRDPDDDQLDYRWFLNGSATPLASSSGDVAGTVTVLLPPGNQQLMLVVSDGHLTGTVAFTIAVLSPRQATAALITQLQEAALSRKITKDLIVHLNKAEKTLAQGKLAATRKPLQSFITKVKRARGRGISNATADELVAAAEEILTALR